MISVCIITKNEEKNLEECLKRLMKYKFEIIVVDTGSTDNTKEMAKKYTDKIYDFEWCDDFSKARNFSIEKATNDFVLILDSDEFITYIDTKKLQILMKKRLKDVGRVFEKNIYSNGNNNLSFSFQMEKFFNKNFYHYEKPVHEQVTRLNGSTNYETYDVPIYIDHIGYGGTPEEIQKKSLRNIKLLEKELLEEKDETNKSYLLYQIGKSYNMMEDYKKTCNYFAEALKSDLDPKLEFVQDMIMLYGYALLNLGQKEFALSLESVYNVFSDNVEFIFMMAHVYMKNGLFDKAVKEFEKATMFKESKMAGTNSYLAFFYIGAIKEVLKDYDEAIKYYEKCGNYEVAKDRIKEIESKIK